MRTAGHVDNVSLICRRFTNYQCQLLLRFDGVVHSKYLSQYQIAALQLALAQQLAGELPAPVTLGNG